jgi:hypothetical protein
MSSYTSAAITQPAAPTFVGTASSTENPNWEIEFCEIGNCGVCCYSYCCTSCALADARHAMDGSNWFVTCCCFGASATRWLLRTAYKIEGNAHWDCWASLLPCCVANQALQTAKARGMVQDIPQVGPQFNLNERTGFKTRSCSYLVYDCMYALICTPCANGLILQNAGLPCWFGACCVNSFAATSILRYQNRIKPMCNQESVTDCIIPCAFVLSNNSTSGLSAPFAQFMYTFCNLVEENERVGREACYGLNLLACLMGTCNYFASGFRCNDVEGRYLEKGI